MSTKPSRAKNRSKNGRAAKKVELINRMNPSWLDLASDVLADE
jgi:hypothetical protein